ncbi:MAG: hypothetical protein A3J47_00320 [Candidatus Yanofskybacteria bacterium RIFCSPHIGHO2_02_FULL_43_22]|uniref:Uncharacterized protein n=1 Tax=Candidatus Yanofskybacteria bacterium RIFCSPHIGHO2_02_FULL_43_22 TaxID=1802681 RepID=A0A1F8FPA6_9BACT|nr:MAG: hypothetical protein A3J47_00320 [Candidatus Yanofskybacteria bacterium RIFCSPHIGHO2_02_FULL_43_22]
MNVAVFLSLSFFFGGYHASALTAPNHTRKSECVASRAWFSLSAEDYLYLVVFFLCDHWFVYAFVPVAAFARIFKRAVIKRVGKKIVSSGSAYWPAARHSKP